MRGTYEACPFGLPVRMNEIQRGQSDQARLSFYHGNLPSKSTVLEQERLH